MVINAILNLDLDNMEEGLIMLEKVDSSLESQLKMEIYLEEILQF